MTNEAITKEQVMQELVKLSEMFNTKGEGLAASAQAIRLLELTECNTIVDVISKYSLNVMVYGKKEDTLEVFKNGERQ